AAGVTDRLQDVCGMCGDRPRRLPPGEAVAAEVGREDAEAPREPLLREPAEPAPVPAEAVKADERRGGALAPLVQLEQHQSAARAATSAGSVCRQSPTRATSASRSIGASGSELRAAITPAFIGPARCSKSPFTATAIYSCGASARP